MPLHELARSIPIPPEKDSMLGRIMALLVHQGIFAQSEAGYLLTPISELLLVEGSNMGIYVHMLTQVDFLQSWERLSEVLTDTGTCTLFEKTFGGKQLWELSKEEPGIGNFFNEAMTSQTKPLMRGLFAIYPHIFDGLHSLVDVGGGTGAAVKIISEAFPGLRCIVFDLPHVVAEVSKNDSFDVVGGDMFEKIPPADAIFIKNILHDWSDEDCVRILKRCKEAIESRKHNAGKVIVVDIIIDLESDDPKEVETSLLFDIDMMCCFGSKERYKKEWHDIILASGYSDYKIYPARVGTDAVIELYP
ncbi:trans-resveratrol di-O-methyltransferase-like [Carex rostrata]